MERIKSRTEDGKQNPEYAKEYYLRNKERIAAQFKTRYQRVKAEPSLNQERQVKQAQATKRYRKRHPDRIKTQDKEQYWLRRQKLFNLLGGAVCSNCGCSELAFLELNHKNGGGSQQYKAFGTRLQDFILSGLISPKGYNVLCRVCNALEHLKRKNPEMAKQYNIGWENFTGRKAGRLDS